MGRHKAAEKKKKAICMGSPPPDGDDGASAARGTGIGAARDEPEPVEPPAPDGELEVPRLKREAVSLAHAMTHRPKSPYCEICARARARQVYQRRGAFHRPLSKRGGTVTADHMDCRGSEMIGIDDERVAFVICDLWPGMVSVYPTATKSADDTVTAMHASRIWRHPAVLLGRFWRDCCSLPYPWRLP